VPNLPNGDELVLPSGLFSVYTQGENNCTIQY